VCCRASTSFEVVVATGGVRRVFACLGSNPSKAEVMAAAGSPSRQLLELLLTGVASDGACVARAEDGRVVFVRHGIPGERVRAEITEEAGSYLRADVVEVLEPSPDRVQPPCRLAGPGRCGGCDFQHINLRAQRGLKAQLILDQLRRIGHFEAPVPVTVEEVSDHLVVGESSRGRFVDGDRRTPGPSPTGESHLGAAGTPLPGGPVSEGPLSGGPLSGGPVSGAGADFSAAEREAAVTNLWRDPAPSRELVDGLGWRTRMRFAVEGSGRLGLHRYRSHELEPIDDCPIAAPSVATLLIESRSFPGASEVEVVASATGDRRVVLVDQRALTEPVREGACEAPKPREPIVNVVAGRSYAISPRSFWQVHPGAAGTLGEAVCAGLEPRPGESVVDLYAGVGLFAGLLGDLVGAQGRVLAVEVDRRAARDARRNLADQPQTKVLTAPVTPSLVAHSIGSPDLLVLDPPRAGAGREVVRALARLAPRRLAYVACDPATFSRDLAVLIAAGWSLASLRGFDIFPMTSHVEIVAIFTPPGSRTASTARAGRHSPSL